LPTDAWRNKQRRGMIAWEELPLVKTKLVGAVLLWLLMNASTPPEKFTWRPASGVRSTSEVYMHIVRANFLMLTAIGLKMPTDLKDGMGTTVTSKADVIRWLKLSLEAVKEARAAETPADLQRKTKFCNTDTTVDSIFLRIIVHNNEHMGQLVAYARMTGVVPPWST
jgi:uncharacterized damage-inducible protein DinB